VVVRGNTEIKAEKEIKDYNDYVDPRDTNDNPSQFPDPGTVSVGDIVDEQNHCIVGQVLGNKIKAVEDEKKRTYRLPRPSVEQGRGAAKDNSGKKRKNCQQVYLPQKNIGIESLDIIESNHQNNKSGGA
jgi:hypothetical protein